MQSVFSQMYMFMPKSSSWSPIFSSDDEAAFFVSLLITDILSCICILKLGEPNI